MPRLLVLCGVVAASGIAAAQAPRQQRAPWVPPPVALSERVRPIQPKPAGAPAKVETAEALFDILQVGAIRPEQEQILVSLIQQTPDSEREEKSDYYFRLADLYTKQMVYYTKLRDSSPQAQNMIKAALLKAVKTYKGLTDNDAFRNYPKLDQALFNYGYTLQLGKYMKEARAVYDKLLKEHPQSIYVPLAHLAFAEYYFDQGQLADAEARYKKILEFPKSTAAAFAQYRVALIAMTQQRYPEALDAFARLGRTTANDAKQHGLHEAALRGISDASVQLGSPKVAREAFKQLDKDSARIATAQLGASYLDQGKAEPAIAIYRELLAADPTNADACTWQYHVAHALLSTGATSAEKVREIEKLVGLRNAYTKNPAVSDKLEGCTADAAAMSREIAYGFHTEAMRGANTEALGYAERLYKLYIDSFPAAAEMPAARAAYAEVLWTRATAEANPRLQPDRWAAAAEAFMIAAGSSPAPDVAAAGLMAWQNAFGIAADVPDLVAASRARRVQKAIPKREARLIAALETYASAQSDPDTTVQASMLAVGLYRRFGHPDKALPLLVQIVEAHPEHPSAELAANLLLDTLIRAKEFAVLLEWVDVLAADTAFITGKPLLQANLQLARSRSFR